MLKFERVLLRIFLKYCTPRPIDAKASVLPPDAYISPEALDRWGIDTNGSPLPDDQKEEIKEFMDVLDH